MSFLLFSAGHCYSQQLSEEAAAKEAQLLLNEYQAELNLKVEQATRFHGTLRDYLVKKSAVKEEKTTMAEQKEALRRLSEEETEQMGTILDGYQMKRYKELKPKIQPI